jgi:hypothetical protein
MKTLLTIAVALLLLAVVAPAQKKSVVIGSKTDRPNALLIVNPQNSDQGVLLPQLSTGQRMSLKPSSPSENGLIVFDTSKKSYYYWSDGNWVRLHNAGITRYQRIDPVHFQELKAENHTGDDNVVIFKTDNTFATVGRKDYGEEIIAPLNMPHGAVMNELTVYYMDNDDGNISVTVSRKTMTGATEQIIQWQSSGASASINSQTFTTFNGLETIDQGNYTYRIVVAFDLDDGQVIDSPSQATQRLYGVKIKYQE